jgi:uncharacterized protein YjaZ
MIISTVELQENPNLGGLFIRFIQEPHKNKEIFIQAFQKFAPSIENEILSASLDHGCSCKNAIVSYISAKPKESAQFLLDFATEHSITEMLGLELTEERLQFKNYIGEVKEIKISEWLDFAKTLNMAVFRSFSVVQKDSDTVLVFFL